MPRPTVHARNLFHTAIAMYDASASYHGTADGYLVHERQSASDLGAAREEAISDAAYGVLTHRYAVETGGDVSLACFRGLMDRHDPDPDDATGDSPRALGNRIGARVIAEFADDGAHEEDDYVDPVGYMAVNPALVVDEAGTHATDPARWQPLNLAVAVTQNGIVSEAGVQKYIGSHWGVTLIGTLDADRQRSHLLRYHGVLAARARRPRRHACRGRPRPRAPEPSAAVAVVRAERGDARAAASAPAIRGHPFCAETVGPPRAE